MWVVAKEKDDWIPCVLREPLTVPDLRARLQAHPDVDYVHALADSDGRSRKSGEARCHYSPFELRVGAKGRHYATAAVTVYDEVLSEVHAYLRVRPTLKATYRPILLNAP